MVSPDLRKKFGGFPCCNIFLVNGCWFNCRSLHYIFNSENRQEVIWKPCDNLSWKSRTLVSVVNLVSRNLFTCEIFWRRQEHPAAPSGSCFEMKRSRMHPSFLVMLLSSKKYNYLISGVRIFHMVWSLRCDPHLTKNRK